MSGSADLSLEREPSLRVLVVDDDDAIRGTLAEALELEGYAVDSARDGREALAHVREEPPKAIVLDLMMPVMDGWTFLDLCRKESLCAGIPIVVVSASYNLRTAAAELSSRGVSAVVAKPYSLDHVIGTIDRLVRPILNG